MNYSFKIGVKNFRVFKEMTEFEIRPITILVGPNNSGKSSFTKLLLLLKNGIKSSISPLDFSRGDHHLKSFKSCLNWETEGNDELVLQVSRYIPFFPDPLIERYYFNKEGEIIRKLLAVDDSEGTIVLNQYLPTSEENGFRPIYFDFNIDYLLNILFSGKLKLPTKFSKYEPDPEDYEETHLSDFKQVDGTEFFESGGEEFFGLDDYFGPKYIRRINLSNYKQQQKIMLKRSFNDHTRFPYEIVSNSIFVNTIKEYQDKERALYRLIIKRENLKNKKKVRESFEQAQNQLFSQQPFIPYTEGIGLGYWEKQDTFNFSLKNYVSSLKKDRSEKLEGILFKKFNLSKEDIQVQPTDLYRLLFSEKVMLGPVEGDFITSNFMATSTFFENILKCFFKNLEIFKNLNYIPVNRGNQSRVLSSNSNHKTFETLTQFQKKGSKNNTYKKDPFGDYREPNKLLEKLLKILGITDEVAVKSLEDVAIAIYIKREDKTVNLADLGFGFSQLLPIILKIYNLTKSTYKFERILIIEEPEANLHPNLQSKLADILLITILHNPDWKIIVETHSEYLIRKLQYLVAKNECGKNDCIIHYFNADENVSENEPKVKPIEINEEGNLTDNFGPGFYDEATKLQFDLLKLNKNRFK